MTYYAGLIAQEDAGFGHALAAFWHALPLDFATTCYLLFIPFLAYLYALGSVGLVRLIWNDAFRMRFIVIPTMMTFSYLADISGIPYGGKISAGLLGFGCGCLIAGMGYYDREAELAGERKRDGEAPERVPVAGSTKKLADITPIFKDKDGRYPGAPPGDRDGRD